MQSYDAHCRSDLRMKRIWRDRVIDCDADDTFHLILASGIEIDAVNYFSSGSSWHLHHPCATHSHRVDGGCDGDAGGGVRSILPHRSRYHSGHCENCGRMRYPDDLRLFLASKVCSHDPAVPHGVPHLHRQTGVSSNDDDLCFSIQHSSLFLAIFRRSPVEIEDVRVILRLP